MSHSLNSLKRGCRRDYVGTTIGVTKGGTGSLGYSSYRVYDICRYVWGFVGFGA